MHFLHMCRGDFNRPYIVTYFIYLIHKRRGRLIGAPTLFIIITFGSLEYIAMYEHIAKLPKRL